MSYRDRERAALQQLAWQTVNDPNAEADDVAAATERLEHVDRDLDYDALSEAELVEFQRLCRKLEGRDVTTGEELAKLDPTMRRALAVNEAQAAQRSAELAADRCDAVWLETGGKPWREPKSAPTAPTHCDRCKGLTDEDLKTMREVIAAEQERQSADEKAAV